VRDAAIKSWLSTFVVCSPVTRRATRFNGRYCHRRHRLPGGICLPDGGTGAKSRATVPLRHESRCIPAPIIPLRFIGGSDQRAGAWRLKKYLASARNPCREPRLTRKSSARSCFCPEKDGNGEQGIDYGSAASSITTRIAVPNVGADYHPGFQQIAFVDIGTGDVQERRSPLRKGRSLVAIWGCKERACVSGWKQTGVHAGLSDRPPSRLRSLGPTLSWVPTTLTTGIVFRLS